MFESIYEEILKYLRGLEENVSYELESLFFDSKRSFIIHASGKVGIGIECKMDKPFHEKFSSIELQYIQRLNLGKDEISVLFLFTNRALIRKNIETPLLKEFAFFCTRFVYLGEKGTNRKYVIENTLEWWKSVCLLVGNSQKSMTTYAVIGELVTYLYLKKIKTSEKYFWTGSDRKRIDFTGEIHSYEVKSSIVREDTSITIHGIFQADNKDLKESYIVFCRFEPSFSDKSSSINSLVCKLDSEGVDCVEIEKHLDKMGFFKGASIRDQRFSLLEMRLYKIDEHFPKLTSDSFVNGKIPSGILDINYTVSLNNLKYEAIPLSFLE